MKIKNLVRIFVLALLLVSGSIPVRAQEPDPCSSVEPIRPGDSVTDAVSDVAAAHIDITEISSSLSGESLTVVFHLRDLPESLTFNRTGLGQGTMEYEWEVAVDVDNDRNTGPGGFDTLLSAYHVVRASEKRRDTTAAAGEILRASVWEIHANGSTSEHVGASLEVSAEADTLTLVGIIPGITSESRLAFESSDALFAGESDQIACHDPYSHFVGRFSCETGAAAITPGQTVTDEAEDATHVDTDTSRDTQLLVSVFGEREGVASAHMDITEVSTSLSGETLTVVFHLRDVPETLTFNRTGIAENYMEYAWEVAIDVDNDRATGDGGFDTLLSAYYIARQTEKEANVDVPIESKAAASVWRMEPGVITSERDASLEVSAEADTITLSGYIPGITAESRLVFATHEYFGSSDEVGCHAPPRPITPSSPCDADQGVTPGQSVIDAVSDALAAHLDITEIKTSLAGETLTVVFHLRDVPETLTFDRSGVPENVTEYSWEVSVDVDGDRETGLAGFEYILSALHGVFPSSAGGNRSAPITKESLQVNTWDLTDPMEIAYLADARIEVSAAEDTITLSAEIPGITADSQLAFGVYDYLAGTEEVGCLTPFGLGRPVGPISPDGAIFTPGQTVFDDSSDELAAHIDIIEVTTALAGETLTVVFHLRDVPETLTFDRTGVPDHVLEYMWGVSIDVDNDRGTGDSGFDYTLSASYFVVHPLARDGNTVAPLTQPGFVEAKIWGQDWEGDKVLRVLAEASIEVSADDNTITLSGEIPGISAASPLKFETYDYFGGSEEIRSYASSNTSIVSGPCDADEAAVTPGQRVIAGISNTLPVHVDITEVSTTLNGETLTVVFHLRDVPESLTFDRTGVPENAMEYMWQASIDVDNDLETGHGGFDYALSASQFAFSPDSDRRIPAAQLGNNVQVDTWESDVSADGSYRLLGRATIEVSTQANTITLSGEIPGITPQSRLAFEAYDFLEGSEQVACHASLSPGDSE